MPLWCRDILKILWYTYSQLTIPQYRDIHTHNMTMRFWLLYVLTPFLMSLHTRTRCHQNVTCHHLQKSKSLSNILMWLHTHDVKVRFWVSSDILSVVCDDILIACCSWDMGWLRFVGSLNDRSLLHKSPIKETIFCSRDL